MISRDFFSVANNLGDSVAFNLESDTLSDRHVPVPIGVSKVPEASGFVRGVAKLGVVTVLGATFHEVNPVARGRLKLVDARQAPAQLA